MLRFQLWVTRAFPCSFWFMTSSRKHENPPKKKAKKQKSWHTESTITNPGQVCFIRSFNGVLNIMHGSRRILGSWSRYVWKQHPSERTTDLSGGGPVLMWECPSCSHSKNFSQVLLWILHNSKKCHTHGFLFLGGVAYNRLALAWMYISINTWL